MLVGYRSAVPLTVTNSDAYGHGQIVFGIRKGFRENRVKSVRLSGAQYGSVARAAVAQYIDKLTCFWHSHLATNQVVVGRDAPVAQSPVVGGM